MTQEKKKLRLTGLDFFIFILLLVVAVAFFAKGSLASLLQNEKELVAVQYTLSSADMDGLSVGGALSSADGRDLGRVTAIRSENNEEGVIWYCDVKGYAGAEADGYRISAETLLKQGSELSVSCEGKEFLCRIVTISQEDVL